ncbi:MAG: alpha/beta hydrolase [Desulfobacteraceae bacterium]|jgi:esterase/lipase superfamily enzyme|nr:alpha/beta hydrolase [Desulfobacteraceae bacterium]
MLKTKGQNVKRQYSLAWPRLRGLLLLSIVVTAACSSGGPYRINLMPAPAVFEDGDINPLPKGQPPVSYDDFRMLYATDRKPSDDPDVRPFYLNEPGYIVRLGHARVKAGPAGTDWEAVRRISLAKNRTGNYPLEVLSVNETGALPSTYSFLTRSAPGSTAPDLGGKKFAEFVNQRLTASAVKDVYVYVHGFRVMFDVPVLVASELWHFLGYRGAFIAYTWPSTPSVFAYLSDLEAAVIMARKLRLFFTYLAEETQVEKIHIVGFSAGSRLLVSALGQLALLNADKTDEQIRTNVRIGNVIIVGGDISQEEFGIALADGLLRIPERTTIYVSSADRALVWARRLFRRERLGQMWAGDLPQRTVDFLGANPSLQFVDVTEAAGSTTGNGHAYLRKSPWVSSDLLTLLAYDIGAAERGLKKEANQLVWTFPPDFIERLRKLLTEMNPD